MLGLILFTFCGQCMKCWSTMGAVLVQGILELLSTTRGASRITRMLHVTEVLILIFKLRGVKATGINCTHTIMYNHLLFILLNCHANHRVLLYTQSNYKFVYFHYIPRCSVARWLIQLPNMPFHSTIIRPQGSNSGARRKQLLNTRAAMWHCTQCRPVMKHSPL